MSCLGGFLYAMPSHVNVPTITRGTSEHALAHRLTNLLVVNLALPACAHRLCSTDLQLTFHAVSHEIQPGTSAEV